MRIEVQFANPTGNEFGDRSTSQSPAAAVEGAPAAFIAHAKCYPILCVVSGNLPRKSIDLFKFF
jgi:hypothetical protein